MKTATPKTEPSPSTQLRKAIFGGSLMKLGDFTIPCLIAMTIAVTANCQDTTTNDWHPNTRLLELGAKYPYHNPAMSDAAITLAHDVKNFYQLLRDKKWRETYELRAKAFREDFSESDYLAKAIRAENIWGLANYEVLSVQYPSYSDATNIDTAILICKFTELPVHSITYATVFWHREDGVWKCLSAGPSKLSIFDGTRSPTIDWR